MIRFTIRQFRMQLLVATICLVSVGIVLGITGPGLVHLFNTTIAHCGQGPACNGAYDNFDARDEMLKTTVQTLSLLLPALIGMFWGAPLFAREIETGTFRLAWTQGISRRQWLIAKLAVVITAAIVVEGLFSLMTTWWWSPVGKVHPDRFAPGLFSEFGIAPIGYVVFAVALGATLGLICRRTLPAMATTLVGFVLAREAITQWVRPHFGAAKRMVYPLNGRGGGFGVTQSPDGVTFTPYPPSQPNGLNISSAVVNHSGQPPTGDLIKEFCPQFYKTLLSNQPGVGKGAFRAPSPQKDVNDFGSCIDRIGQTYHLVAYYQPANHYWPFQFVEVAVFVVAAFALTGLSLFWVRRRML